VEHLSFAALGVTPGVVETLARRGVVEPFAVQRRVLADALAGRDALVQSPTGSGKTLAFGIPLVERLDASAPPTAGLVLVPTRELAAQVAAEIAPIATARGLRVARAYGGVSVASQARLAARAHILVATPGRLDDLAGRGDVRLEHVRMLVLDEADRMLDMGFLPQVERLVARTPRSRQTMFFSATLDGACARAASAWTRDPVRHREDERVEVSGPVEHRFVPVAAETRVDALVELLVDQGDGRSLVFVRTRHGADRLVKKLARAGVRAAVMHGSKTQAARERALGEFAAGRVRALVATDVAARGIDIADVTHVVNFDPPADAAGYTHRVGRTGRAGRAGTGITLVSPEHGATVTRVVTELELEDAYTAGGLALDRPGPLPRAQRRAGRGRRPAPARR
jgi:ATP-dependent RNA helicase RhlE